MTTTLILAACLAFAPIPKGAGAESPAQKVKVALDEVGSVVIENKSLTDFVAYIKAKTRIDVILDNAVIGMMGMDPNSPTITVTVRDVKLREGLAQALAPLGLKIGAVGGAIVISSEEGLIARQMRQRVSISSGSTASVLADLANRTGANVVLDPRQKKSIAEATSELELTDVTLETAVRLAAEVSGFRAVRMGNVLFVTSNERAEKLRADADGPTLPQGAIPTMMGVEDRPGGGLLIPPLVPLPPPPTPLNLP